MPRHLAIGIPRTILAHSSNTSWLAKCLGSLFVPSAGLGLSYLGWPFMAYGELCGARSNLYADKASLATLAFFVAAMVIMRWSRVRFSSTFAKGLTGAGVVLQSLSLATLGVLNMLGMCTETTKFVFSALLMTATGIVLAEWLGKARDLPVAAITIYVFQAIAISGVLFFGVEFMSPEHGAIAISILILAQFPAGVLSGRLSAEGEPCSDRQHSLFENSLSKPRFLTTFAIGLFALILVTGFLCGFPDDLHRPLGIAGNVALLALTLLICIGIILSILRYREGTVTVGVWIVLELLAAFSLVLYSASHADYTAGAVVSITMNFILMGTMWCFTIMLMAAGPRDSLYYGCVAWVIWFSAHDLGRFMLLALPVGGNSHFTGSLISLLLLVSTQIILVKLLGLKPLPDDGAADADEETPADAPAEADAGHPHVFERFLGLDDETQGSSPVDASIRDQARDMGRQFLLSERETEVLALYVMGHTQRRVAEELFISPTTAHTHITRIYSKTDLHSRQELLDFMHEHYS